MITASANEHLDLYFALRAGGPFYAIVLEWTLALRRTPALVTEVVWSWENINAGDQASAMLAYNAMEPWELPRNVSKSEIFLRYDEKSGRDQRQPELCPFLLVEKFRSQLL